MDFLSVTYILAALVAAIYLYTKWSFSYWKRQGLEYLEPEFPYGNMNELMKGKLAFGDQFLKIYKEFKARGLKQGGYYFFLKPSYMPLDLEIIKCILQKDFHHFVNHGLYAHEKADPLSCHLFNLEDDKWRKLRTKLSPTFTSGKMKMMFQTLIDCTSGLGDILGDSAKIQDSVDIKDVLSRFTTDVIGSCAFGLDCNSLKNPDSEFRQIGKKIFDDGFVATIKRTITFVVPRGLLYKIGFKLTDTSIEHFFLNLVKNTVEYREKNNIFRKDFMHLLLQLKNRGEVAEDENVVMKERKELKDTMSLNEMTAQCFVFFVAGFETSATTMTFALLELAQNKEIQDKLREEIVSVLKKHDGQVTYDAIMEMHYLDKIVHETLRRHPPIPGLPRVCNKDYQLPGTNVVLKKNTRVFIPVQGIQMDPQYYPNPEKFDPERFSEENKTKRHTFAFIPFGEGPRLCIGARFGLMQSKVGLTSIIRDFRITLNEKTKIPIKYTNTNFVNGVDGDVWLNVQRLNQSK